MQLYSFEDYAFVRENERKYAVPPYLICSTRGYAVFEACKNRGNTVVNFAML